MFTRTGASVVMAVLVIAISAGGAHAASVSCAAILNSVCTTPGEVVDKLASYDDTTGTSEDCCTANTCATGSPGTQCNTGYYFDGAQGYLDAGLACTASTAECFSGLRQCCVAKTCGKVDVDGNDFCPYGYKLVTASADLDTLSVEDCCERITTVSDTDATNIAFPICRSAQSGGALTGVQASSLDDTNWALQDNNAFARSLGKYTGMCFSVRIDNDCSEAESLIAPKCCSKKAPAFLQFKLPNADGVTSDIGAPLTTIRSTTLTDANVRKCKLSYGTPTSTVRALKPITRWQAVASGADGRFFNVPLTFRRGAKQATVCVYSNSLFNAGLDCRWETLCGFSDDSVPTADGVFAKGCEMRLAGRRSASSTPCCSPTYAVESFDSTESSRLAGGSDVTDAIQIVAPGSN